MTTLSEILTAVFRTQNLIAVGGSPTTAQTTEALARMNAFITFQYDRLVPGLIQDWPVPPPQRTAPVAANYPFGPGASDLPSSVWPYPPVNARLMSSITAATTVYLQYAPNDGAQMFFVDLGQTATLTIDANGRKIEAAATKAITTSPTSPQRWFYRADTGNWQAISATALVGGDSSPFPAALDDFLILGTFIRICSGFGKEASAATAQGYADALKQFNQRYRQPTDTPGNGDVVEPEYPFTGSVDDSTWMT